MSNVRMWDKGSEQPFELGGRRVDPASRRIDFEDEVVEVEPRVMAVLIELVGRPGETVSRDDLIASVWRGAPGADQSLSNAISLLRRALRDTDTPHQLIRTVPKQGYRLCVRPEPLTESPDESGQPTDDERTVAGRRRGLRLAGLGAALLLTASVIAVWYWPSPRDSTPELLHSVDPQTIAVLPFESFSDSPDDVYFADGLAEEILHTLTQVRTLTVASRTSSFQYRGSDASIGEIARELGVAHVLEGSVRRDGDKLRITAQLISAADDSHVWSSTYDRNIDQILEIQRDIAVNIADALADEITRDERALLEGMPTEDATAYENYLIGQHELRKWSPESNQRAIRFLEDAVENDPTFAEARLALGRAYYFAGTHYGSMTPAEAIPKVKASIAYGVSASNPLTRASALAVYGDVLAWSDRDWQGALVAFQRAYELSGSPSLGYGLTNSIIGRHDAAIAIFKTLLRDGARGIGIDDEISVRNNLAWAYVNARRYEEALEQAGRVLAEDPAFADGYRVLGRAQLQLGDVDAAIESFSAAVELMNGAPVAISDKGVALARAGRETEAREILSQLETTGVYISAPLVAQVHANLGDTDAAFRWLQKGLADGDRGVVFLKINPFYDPIRQDPRFADVLGQLNLGD